MRFSMLVLFAACGTTPSVVGTWSETIAGTSTAAALDKTLVNNADKTFTLVTVRTAIPMGANCKNTINTAGTYTFTNNKYTTTPTSNTQVVTDCTDTTQNAASSPVMSTTDTFDVAFPNDKTMTLSVSTAAGTATNTYTKK